MPLKGRSLVAGVDSSTSACKVEVRDSDSGELVSSGRAAHPPTRPPRSEQDPVAWERAFAAACAEAGIGDRHRVSAISVAGQQHGLVVVDGAGSPLRPAKLWNDTESAGEAAELVDALGPEAWAEACGSVPVASFTISKLLWLRRSEPEVFRQVAGVLLPHDWLTGRLTGVRTTDRGDASGTGYWSPAEGRYRFDLLALVDCDVDWAALVPTVLGPRDQAGEWSANGAMVAPGTGDNMAAALGVSARAGDLVLSLGTSGTAFTVSDEASADPSGTVAGFADATGRFLPLVCTLNATKVTDTVACLLGVDHSTFDQLALEPGSARSRLVLVPHLDGERTPNRPDATGTLSGLTTGATRGQLARAAVNGVVCNLLAGAARLPGGDGRVFVVGGGARSRAYRQVVADLVGRPVVAVEGELVARGAALQAAAVLQGRGCEEVAVDWGVEAAMTVDPAPDADAAAVLDAYERAAALHSGAPE